MGPTTIRLEDFSPLLDSAAQQAWNDLGLAPQSLKGQTLAPLDLGAHHLRQKCQDLQGPLMTAWWGCP